MILEMIYSEVKCVLYMNKYIFDFRGNKIQLGRPLHSRPSCLVMKEHLILNLIYNIRLS